MLLTNNNINQEVPNQSINDIQLINGCKIKVFELYSINQSKIINS